MRTQARTPVTVADKVSWFRRGIERLTGFDFFVSYAHADGTDYAEVMTRALRDKGFSAFLDRQVYVPGDELNQATLTRIRNSSKLIVIVGESALESYWVLREVQTALELGRPVIAIDLNAHLDGDVSQSGLAALLSDRIHVREQATDATARPSEATLEALTRSFQATRRETLRLRVALGAMAFFALLAGFAFWQSQVAQRQTELANRQTQLASERADQYRGFCEDVVSQVKRGRDTIDSLRYSQFGKLVANITDELARLPPPDSLNCTPTGSDALASDPVLN